MLLVVFLHAVLLSGGILNNWKPPNRPGQPAEPGAAQWPRDTAGRVGQIQTLVSRTLDQSSLGSTSGGCTYRLPKATEDLNLSDGQSQPESES